MDRNRNTTVELARVDTRGFLCNAKLWVVVAVIYNISSQKSVESLILTNYLMGCINASFPYNIQPLFLIRLSNLEFICGNSKNAKNVIT